MPSRTEMAILSTAALFIIVLRVAARLYGRRKIEFHEVWQRRKVTRKKGEA
jgi:hypothetical protein